MCWLTNHLNLLFSALLGVTDAQVSYLKWLGGSQDAKFNFRVLSYLDRLCWGSISRRGIVIAYCDNSLMIYYLLTVIESLDN